MSPRSNDLAERLKAFNNEMISFVEGCSSEDWKKVCAWEKWSVGTTAYHIGKGHFNAIGLARMIVNGEKLPQITMDEVVRTANRDAREHETCSKEEVLEVLTKNGQTMVEFVEGLKDSELDQTGYVSILSKEITARHLLETVILQGGGQHFNNIKTAIST
jgi:hypothetical protein